MPTGVKARFNEQSQLGLNQGRFRLTKADTGCQSITSRCSSTARGRLWKHGAHAKRRCPRRLGSLPFFPEELRGMHEPTPEARSESIPLPTTAGFFLRNTL